MLYYWMLVRVVTTSNEHSWSRLINSPMTEGGFGMGDRMSYKIIHNVDLL